MIFLLIYSESFFRYTTLAWQGDEKILLDTCTLAKPRHNRATGFLLPGGQPFF